MFRLHLNGKTWSETFASWEDAAAVARVRILRHHAERVWIEEEA